MRSLKLDSTPWYQHGAFRALDVKRSLANTSYLFTEIRSGRGGAEYKNSCTVELMVTLIPVWGREGGS